MDKGLVARACLTLGTLCLIPPGLIAQTGAKPAPAPDKTAAVKTAPDKTAPDKTAPDKTAPDKTAPDKTAPAQAPAAARPNPPKIDLTVLHVQVLLDHLGFSPGVLDGRPGSSLKKALTGFQGARGLPVTGETDKATLEALHPYVAIRPVRALTLAASDFDGPFVGPLPRDPAAQAKLPTLGYANILEMLSERFHTTPQTLAALNPGVGELKAGMKLNFPNALADARDYDPKLSPEWRATLNLLNVSSNQPKADHVEVSKHEGVLKVLDADDKVIAQFPATMGSEHDPLPIGTWKIQGADYNPKFHYNPALFWDAKATDKATMLPAGPNGPVGVVWLDLNKPHYGIHGTPAPENIGKTESHGCIRLTNWDAARLSLMVHPGTIAKFVE